ncbi:MAG: hypothetical protein AB1641_14755 [Thermodesulfobacteriota bacterium]
MNEESSEAGAALALTADLWALFEKVGRSLGREVYRIILRPEGRGEIEIRARNPIECLVLRWENPAEMIRFLASAEPPLESALARKKCTRCLLHERKAGPEEFFN